MDARSDVIVACAAGGSALLQAGHRAAAEVSAALGTLERETSALHALWDQRRVLYLQCMDLQLFYRDTEQADAWMHKQEVYNTFDVKERDTFLSLLPLKFPLI